MTTDHQSPSFEPGIDPRSSGFEAIDFGQLFGNSNPIALEIGSGKGRWLIESAGASADLNFVGIEKSLHYFRVIRDRIGKRDLRNARIVNHDAFQVISKMIPNGSIREVHVYFPDPWPRPREQKRRIIREEVLEQLIRILEPEGRGIYVTDHQEYFEAALPLLTRYFDAERSDPLTVPPRTNYEAKYREQGRAIYEATFRRRRSDSGE